jgi:hypothetical protein
LILDRWMVSPPVGEVVTEYGPDMGKPMFYNVIADYAAIPKAKIHYSRVIRMEGADLPFYQRVAENGWGLVSAGAAVGSPDFVRQRDGRHRAIGLQSPLARDEDQGLRSIIAAGGPALAGSTRRSNSLAWRRPTRG